jgi:GNAT superfamily N-acetyltransferase
MRENRHGHCEPPAPKVTFAPCGAGDFETMLEIRLSAMRESLERLERFDPQRSRERLARSFYPDASQFIMQDGQRIGFYTFRRDADGFHLEHFYLLPAHTARGIGSRVLKMLTRAADCAGVPVFLGALKGSRANRFYERHGFERNGESEWDIYYVRRALWGKDWM